MADGFIRLPPDGSGKKLDSEVVDLGAGDVYRERHQIAGRDPAALLELRDTDPTGDDYALPARVIAAIAPARSALSSVNLSAGTSVSLDAATIPNGKVGKLAQVTLASSVACKWVIETRAGATVLTIDTLMTSGLTGGRPMETWRPPHKDYAQLAGNGVDTNFRVTATNLDADNAANVYATPYWDEVDV